MNIDMSTMKTAMYRFEDRHGSLKDLLNDLTKSERRKLLRYGKLSKKVINRSSKDKVEELFNVSFELHQILNGLIKPRCLRRK